MKRVRTLYFRLLIGIAASLAILAAAVVFGSSAYVLLVTAPYRFTQTPPERPVAIVFGAGVNPNGSLSPMLRDRVDEAVSLLKAGTVKKLLMTGDNGELDYNEPARMTVYATQKGVPASDIIQDYAGFSTYDSCYRAHAVFGVTSAIAVTQAYHLPRAIFTCRNLGIDTVGVALPDWERYPEKRLPYGIREIGARVKALYEVIVTRPDPKFLGPFQGLTGQE